MPRKESVAVPEGNGPIPQNLYVMTEITLEDFCRTMSEEMDKIVDKHIGQVLGQCEEPFRSTGEKVGRYSGGDGRGKSQCSAGLEQDVRQPRLAIESDVQTDTKTRERMEGAATAVQAMHGYSFSANRVHPGSKITSTSFVMKAEPPALPCKDDVLVENGAAAPKSCLPPLEMRTTTAAGGFLPTGKTTTAIWTTLDRPTLWFCLTEDESLRTSTSYALYYNSSFWLNQLPASSWRRLIQTKSRQNLMFDPGGSRSFPRLPVFGNVARVALWGGSR